MREVIDHVGEIGGTGNHISDADWGDIASRNSSDPSECDACQFCNDICKCPSCEKCTTKRNSLPHSPNRRGEYTRCQIRRHRTQTDCWLIAHGRVYDASSFISHHPAGVRPILCRAGQDCTVDYDFHSKVSQREYWRPLMMGKVVRCPGEECLSSSSSIFPSACVVQ